MLVIQNQMHTVRMSIAINNRDEAEKATNRRQQKTDNKNLQHLRIKLIVKMAMKSRQLFFNSSAQGCTVYL